MTDEKKKLTKNQKDERMKKIIIMFAGEFQLMSQPHFCAFSDPRKFWIGHEIANPASRDPNLTDSKDRCKNPELRIFCSRN